MAFWGVMIALNFLVASIGLSANFFYFKLVVFNACFDEYCRVASFIISSGMTLMISSNVISVIMCLSYGSYFDSGPCGQTDAHFFMLYLHAYGEFSIADGIFILVIERYASVFFASFRSSEAYRLLFLALISLHILALCTYLYLMVRIRTTATMLLSMSFLSFLYVVSFILVIYLLCAAKRRYYETMGQISLTKRYMLSESYELCRSSLPATCVSLTINIVFCVSTWLLILEYILYGLFYEFFVFGNIVMNLDATLFPILFLYGSKKIRKKMMRINPFQTKINLDSGNGVMKLDGHRISFSQSQNEYFDQLRSSWE